MRNIEKSSWQPSCLQEKNSLCKNPSLFCHCLWRVIFTFSNSRSIIGFVNYPCRICADESFLSCFSACGAVLFLYCRQDVCCRLTVEPYESNWLYHCPVNVGLLTGSLPSNLTTSLTALIDNVFFLSPRME